MTPSVKYESTLNSLVLWVLIAFHESPSIAGPFLHDAHFGSVAHVAIGAASPVHIAALLALPVVGGKQTLE